MQFFFFFCSPVLHFLALLVQFSFTWPFFLFFLFFPVLLVFVLLLLRLLHLLSSCFSCSFCFFVLIVIAPCVLVLDLSVSLVLFCSSCSVFLFSSCSSCLAPVLLVLPFSYFFFIFFFPLVVHVFLGFFCYSCSSP